MTTSRAKRPLSIVVAWVLASVLLRATLPTNYNFTSGDSFATHFTQTQGTNNNTGNQLNGVGAAENTGYWKDDVYGNDQYSQALYVNGGGGSGTPGVTVRHSGSGGTTQFYLFTGSSTGSGQPGKLYKVTSGTSYSAALQTTGNITNGNTIKLSVTGTTLETFIDTGSGLVSQGTVTDSGLSSGSAGVYVFGTAGKLDDFVSDTIAGGTTPTCRLALTGAGCDDDHWHLFPRFVEAR